MANVSVYLAALAALLATGCMSSMAWPIECGQTKRSDIERMYGEELYSLHMRGDCDVYAIDPERPGPFLSECPGYHTIWRRYWASRRMLERCDDGYIPVGVKS